MISYKMVISNMSLSFSDLHLERKYTTEGELSPSKDFYNPVLSRAILYQRVAGYFSSSSFAFIGDGLYSFIQNNGKMQFIFNVQLLEEDYKQIELGLSHPEKIIESKFLSDLSTIEDECVKNHAKLLGWLLAHNILDVKIGYLEPSITGQTPILHQKSGVFVDQNGNTIAFTGSNNESAMGWEYNSESFYVFCDWKSGQNDYVTEIKSEFDLLWENKQKKTKVIPFPEAVKLDLIQIAPQSEAECIKLLIEMGINTPREKGCSTNTTIKMRDYQQKAVSAWMDNNCQGILEMATGTGKTITALYAYAEMLKREEKLVLLVTCPYTHLPIQWEKTIERMDIRSEIRAILRADGNTKKWEDTIYATALDLLNVSKKSKQKSIVILATNDTASSDKFQKMFEKIQTLCHFNWMIISDEVHSIGSPTYQKALNSEYQYRLGLSATPDRYFDKSGSDFLREYFGKTVFQFSLREAIDTINPDTGTSYLVPYDYHVLFTTLTNEELEAYVDLTHKIIKLENALQNSSIPIERDNLDRLYMKRQEIVKNAANKFDVFTEIIQKLYDENELNHLLIYCSDSDPTQITRVGKYLETLSRQKKRLIKFRKYTSNESSRVSKKAGCSERDKILEYFDKGDFEVLLAMKCLDEGVDVPSTRSAILLCSSGNPKEYIQRRGRILRPFEGKKKAVLYDIAVIPFVEPGLGGGEGGITSVSSIMEKEKKRMWEFSKDSLNQPDIDLIVDQFLEKMVRKR